MKKLALFLLLAGSSNCFAMKAKRTTTLLLKSILKEFKTHNHLKKIELTIRSAQLELSKLEVPINGIRKTGAKFLDKQREAIETLWNEDKK